MNCVDCKWKIEENYRKEVYKINDFNWNCLEKEKRKFN